MNGALSDWARRRARLALQLIVSVALLVWIVKSVSWPELLATVADASPLLMALACGLYYLGVALSCWKWRLLLQLEQIELPFGRLFRWYLIGAFAGNYLPTEVGGDLGRGLVAGRATGRPLAIARSILIERLSGLLFMLAIAWVGLIVVLGQNALALGIALAGLGALIVGGVVLRHPMGMPLGGALHGLWRRAPGRLRAMIADSLAAGGRYLQRPRAMAMVAALSLAFQILAGVGVWLNLLAVGAAPPLAITVLIAAMAGVVGMLPITLNGWGVREGLFVALLTSYGATASQALAAALLGRALILLVTLPGALSLALERPKVSSAPRPTPEQ